MLELCKFRAAAVQTAPVFLDTVATVEKAVRLIAEAAGNGARLVAFPEVFISAYPYWSWIGDPVQGSNWFERLARSAITIPGPEISRIAEAAAQHRINVVIGANERSPSSIGTIFNTVVVISEEGRILGRHRKLVPTLAEIDCSMSFTCGHASLWPPGMMLGPLSAPSSPPETPVPMKCSPASRSAFVQRFVSGKD